MSMTRLSSGAILGSSIMGVDVRPLIQSGMDLLARSEMVSAKYVPGFNTFFIRRTVSQYFCGGS